MLAERLDVPFVDLDFCFLDRVGDISDHIDRLGYLAYARANVDLYRTLDLEDAAVIALSSGFMTYPDDVHPDYAETRALIAASPTTFVLLPSLELDTCVAEIVRRQMQRPLGLVASREEHVATIRARFPVYTAVPATKVTTMRPPGEVAEEIISELSATATGHR